MIEEINKSSLSEKARKELVEIIKSYQNNFKNEFKKSMPAFTKKYPDDAPELKKLYATFQEIIISYFTTGLEHISETEMRELTKNLQTQYWHY